MYEALGNIFNGLQIALLLFSSFTLPLFFIKTARTTIQHKFNYFNFFKFIPIIALTSGFLIHLVGLFNLIADFKSLWILWVHVSMTIFNTGLIYALWKRMKFGYIIGIQHENGFFSIYKNNERVLKQVGSDVRVGEVIGIVGAPEKQSTDSYLHFELWQKGKPINPSDYIIF